MLELGGWDDLLMELEHETSPRRFGGGPGVRESNDEGKLGLESGDAVRLGDPSIHESHCAAARVALPVPGMSNCWRRSSKRRRMLDLATRTRAETGRTYWAFPREHVLAGVAGRGIRSHQNSSAIGYSNIDQGKASAIDRRE